MAKPFQLGMLLGLEGEIAELFSPARRLGLDTCQLAVWSEDVYERTSPADVRRASEESGVEVTALWSSWPGPRRWNFVEGPLTLGLVPPEFRAERLRCLIRASDFARALGVRAVATHVGFVPEDPNDPKYAGLIAALRYLADHCKENGQEFWFETGQETPVTLLRCIQDVGAPNLGINFDPANLLMYGKANPLDALDVFGHDVKGVHIKDGDYPTDGRALGPERPVGEGRVDFAALLQKLHALGYTGTLTIEREISGDRQIKDIEASIEYLRPIISHLD